MNDEFVTAYGLQAIWSESNIIEFDIVELFSW